MCHGYNEKLWQLDPGDDWPTPYELFPLRDLRELHAKLLQADCRDLSEACRERVVNFLRTHRACFWGTRAPSDDQFPEITVESLLRMRRWAEGSGLEEHDRPLREPWRHKGFLDPETDFKKWLFYKWGAGISTKFVAGNWVTGVVLRRSEIDLPKWVPFIGGRQAFHDSRLEFFAHFDNLGDQSRTIPVLPEDPDENGTGEDCEGDQCPCQCVLPTTEPGSEPLTGPIRLQDVGVNFYSSRGRRLAYFFGASYRDDVDRGLALSTGFEFGLPTGVLDERGSLMINVGFSGGVFRTKDRGLNGRLVAVEFGLRYVWGFGRPKHPLSY